MFVLYALIPEEGEFFPLPDFPITCILYHIFPILSDAEISSKVTLIVYEYFSLYSCSIAKRTPLLVFCSITLPSQDVLNEGYLWHG